MNAKCNLTPDEEREALKQFEGFLTIDEEERIRSFFPQYLFFHNDYDDGVGGYTCTPVRICTCTACKESFVGVRANYPRGKIHNEPVTCPACGKTLIGKCVTKYKYDMASLEGFVHTAVARRGEDGALLIEAGLARRTFTHDNLIGDIDWMPTKRYYFSSGKCGMFEKRLATYSCVRADRTYKWLSRKSISDPFAPNMMGSNTYAGDYNVVGLEVLGETSLKYCQIDDFFRYYFGCDIMNCDTARYIVKYLGWYALQPQIEMCVKFNLLGFVGELIVNGKKNARVLDWSKNTAHEFLRLSKADAKTFLRSGVGIRGLRIYKEKFRRFSFTKYLEILEGCGGEKNLDILIKCADAAGVGIDKAIKYVRSQTPMCARAGVSTGDIIGYWHDYLKMAVTLEYDMSEETVIMPKNLKERHDAAAAIIKFQASELKQKKYAKRKKALEKKYSFTLGELSVIVPQSAEEIVREGQTLHHCVAGYAKRHIEGTSTILFLRKKKKPWRSFLTIELAESGGKIFIRQVHGYRNENYGKNYGASPVVKYGEWLDTWIAWVNAGSKRDNGGRPILPKTNKEKTA